MAKLRDTARAKVNLTLEVKGLRPDRYHELVSLVAFAWFGDVLELDPGRSLELEIDGPFAAALDLNPDNLVLRAARAAKEARPELRLGRFKLTKHLPVASGIGGGSADAAAALRLLREANPGMLQPELLAPIAASLGSDVTVCLASRPSLMTGRGEVVAPVEGFPQAGLLLVNSGDALSTAKVYAELGAAPLADPLTAAEPAPDFGGSFERLIGYAEARTNDLEAPALKLAPAIGEVLASLRTLTGVRLVRLSGSGATCFALFATLEEAERGGALLAASRPSWWIQAAGLG